MGVSGEKKKSTEAISKPTDALGQEKLLGNPLAIRLQRCRLHFHSIDIFFVSEFRGIMQRYQGLFLNEQRPSCCILAFSITGTEVDVLVLQTYNFNLSDLAVKRIIWMLAS